MTDNLLEVNNTVILNSGGPLLRVIYTYKDYVICCWHDNGGMLWIEPFPSVCLTPIRTIKDYIAYLAEGKIYLL